MVEISTIVHMTANVAAVRVAVAMLPNQMGMARTRSLTTENVVVGDALGVAVLLRAVLVVGETAKVGGAMLGVEAGVRCPDAEVLPISMNGGLLA